MRSVKLLFLAAVAGLTVGGVWAAWSSGVPAATAATAPAADAQLVRTLVETPVYYSGCNEVRSLGKDPLYAGDPGYRTEMDGDSDGIACEPYRY